MNVKNITLNRLALLGLVIFSLGLGLSQPSFAGDKTPKMAKTEKKLFHFMMKQVVNKKDYPHEAMMLVDQEPPDEPTASNGPVEKNILSRLKITEAITPETTDLLGESIDLASGTVGFKQTDVSLPGNSSLEVAVRRVFKGRAEWLAQGADFSDWHLDVPSIHTTLKAFNGTIFGPWGTGHACSDGSMNPGISYDMHHIFESYQYWNGDTLNVPGHVNDKLMIPSSNLREDLGGDFNGVMRVTRSNWRIKCVARTDANGAAYEGFKAFAPDGTIYTFDKLRMLAVPPVPYTPAFHQMKLETEMRVSKVEDRFGNWVNYDYDAQTRLTSIRANDGREITLTYLTDVDHAYNIDTVTANGRVWSYNYTGDTAEFRTLSTVTRPDGRQWIYQLGELGHAKPRAENLDDCDFNPQLYPSLSGAITHPYGAKGTFTVKETRHGEANIDRSTAIELNVQKIPRCTTSLSLVQKTLTGPGLTPLTWYYQYSSNTGTLTGESPASAKLNDAVPTGIDPLTHKTTTVYAPDSSITRYFYNRDWSSALEGSLALVEQYDTDGSTVSTSTLLSSTRSDYAQAESVGNTWMFKTNVKPLQYRLNKTQDVQTLYHSDGSTRYTTEYQNYDSLGVSTLTYQHNTANSKKKYSQQSYIHHLNGDYYLLHLPTTTALSSTGVVGSFTTTHSTDYYDWNSSAPSQPKYQYRFGQWQSLNHYHPDGNVSRIDYNALTDQNTARYQIFTNYKRGQPGHISLPDAVGASSHSVDFIIDDNGWVTQTQDFKRNTIHYHYDTVGRLDNIDPADSQWADTTIDFDPVSDAEETGVSAGMFKQTVTKAGLQKTTYLDALMRPVLVKTQDTTHNIAVYQKTAFNAYNKATFSAYPSASAGNTQGVTTDYDGMQRETTLTQYGVGGNTTYHYLAGNKRQTIDNRSNRTTITYLAYGKPAYTIATTIAAPESVTTTMAINLFGNLTSINQGGLTEYRYYDTQQRLCQSYRNDIGKTVYDYNALGEMMWYAQGASGATSGCSKTDVPASERVTLSYTNRGTPKTTNFADANTPDISTGYDLNGNVTSVQSGTTHWVYDYNSQNQILSETLSLDNQTFSLIYGYNNLGNLSSLTYPSGRTVGYATNAFGQHTQAVDNTGTSIYATAASYHPNGTLTNFTFGNGLTYNLTLNSRQLPEHLTTLNGTTALVDLTYHYDNNGNTSDIVDGVDPSYNITMGYDGLDRLTKADGKWGTNTRFAYDTMGNITSKTLGSMAVSYTYHPTTRRLDNATVTGSKTKSYTFAYNNSGAVTHNGTTALPRNQANQVISAGTGAGGHSFIYDGNGKRVKDLKNNIPRYSIYNQAGQMLYQWDQRSETITDYIFLGGKLVTESQISLGDGSQSVDNTNVGYTGHQWDQDSGLNYMQARYYDPLLGRFYSNDPADMMEHIERNNTVYGFNRYTYANNNPYRYKDPDGRFVCGGLCVIGVGIGVGLAFDYAIETIRGEDNSTANTTANEATGGAVAATGPFADKPRGGVAGGGPAGSKTSVASKANHALAKSGAISTATRNTATKILRKVPYIGSAIAAVQLGDAIVDRIESETSNETETTPEPEPIEDQKNE